MQTRKEVCKDFSEQGWEVRFNFSLKQAIKEERNVLLTKLLQLLTTSYMITKELSTNGRQFFQGVLHFSALRLRAIEHTTAREPLPPAPVPRCEWLASAPAESRPGARAWEAWGLLSAAPASCGGSQAAQERTNQVTCYSSYFSAYAFSDSK